MKYWQKIRVTSWFYEGSEFTVIWQDYWNITNTKRYILAWEHWILKWVNYNNTIEEMTFEESSLELIEASKDREIKKISEQLENEIISSLELIK